jgi:excinuclease ABC subunit C
MREVVGRRYSRLQQENKRLPDLVLIDGGVGQLHAAADALAGLEIINQPLASIAKREEILYVHGREDEPIALDHHSPALHLIQQIRDEAHRFAVTFHRKRRTRRELASELLEVPGVGERTARKLLEHFGSLSKLKSVSEAELSQIVTQKQAIRIMEFLAKDNVKLN